MKRQKQIEYDGKLSNSNSEAAVDTYPGSGDETTEANSNSGVAVNTYPGNADKRTEANEDDEKVSNSNSGAAVDKYPRNADETTEQIKMMTTRSRSPGPER